jgi:hypothetical protein
MYNEGSDSLSSVQKAFFPLKLFLRVDLDPNLEAESCAELGVLSNDRLDLAFSELVENHLLQLQPDFFLFQLLLVTV